MHKRRAALTVALFSTASLLAFAAAAHDDDRRTELYKPGVTFASEEPTMPASDGSSRPPLYTGLGDGSYPVTTANAEAQAYFDQGLKLAWAFNHAEARRAFLEAQRLDPNCAMCFWGEAFVLGQNINDGMRPEAIAPAHAALSRALALAPQATAKEQALINALAKRYSADPDADRAALNSAWADAMRAVAKSYPGDVDIQVIFADALMNLQPWDYWEADGKTPKGNGGEIVATLEKALELNPRHPAAAHLYIHAVEASSTPERAEPYADLLRGATPAAGHLVHMPAHIYARVGRHADSLAVNREAVAADEAMLVQMGDSASPLYRYGYYPHNVHFLLVAAQMSGARDDALEAAAKLGTITSDAVSDELAWVQAIKTAPYSAAAMFAAPEAIAEMPDPGDRFPFVKGYWHYARGVGLAQIGAVEEAADEAAAIGALIEKADFAALEAQYLPADIILGIAKNIVEARIEQAEGNLEAAETKLRAAIALEDSIAYMEPPYWYYPVRQTLAANLYLQGRYAESAATFREALARLPKNGWALWGLMQAEMKAGDPNAAETKRQFEAVWLGDRSQLAIERL
ncbi:MAG TPA: tetratricopeptide repeat protein [Bauldia sp.]|nr:tetratricopeptide repeat protein [Bauldia sp.]